MTRKIRSIFLFFIRLILVWMVDTISLRIMARLVKGIFIQASEPGQVWIVAASAVMVLGVVNFLLRPSLLLVALPLGGIAVMVFGFLLNGFLLMSISRLLPDFEIYSWWVAFLGGFVFSLVNTVLTNLLTIDDEDSYYQNLVERRAKKQNIFPDSRGSEQGVLMLEIDGLSYHHMKKALAEGAMPTLSDLVENKGYRLHRVETGIPSMTSSCQAGILYGDNYDIPSFRWYDRDLNRMITSQMDAAMLDQRYSKGQGLVRGGSSVGNMLNGDALKSMFVIATIKAASKEEAKQRARDIYLMMLNPYFFVRTIVLFFTDAIFEVFQYFRQVVRNVQPRLNRLHKGYPLMRAALTSFLKDVSAYLIILDIVRGTPALYHTYAGYDEMAHHAGPWSGDAFYELRRFDKVIARLLRVMAEKAPRSYELIVLSDHGQSFGHTFLQRYGVTLHGFIQQQMPQGKRVMAASGSDDGSTGVMSMINELDNIQQQEMGGTAGRAVLQQANRLLKQGARHRGGQISTGKLLEEEAEVKVAFSGNLANVYFTDFNRRVNVSELNESYPGMVDALVQHEGVGFVVGYDDEGTPVCFGKKGARNLHTGDVVGEDPLAPFAGSGHNIKDTEMSSANPTGATVELRAEQVRRVADFPHAGDLIVNSPIYPDGTVAAYEELIGSHGGVGGEQTDAFILAPGDVQVTETRNSVDVFGILNARRGLTPRPLPQVTYEAADSWALSTIISGLARVKEWIIQAARVLVFDREAYREVAVDPNMTGPALLIAILSILIPAVFTHTTGLEIFSRLGIWVLDALILWLAGRSMGSREDFTPLFRAFGFAQVCQAWLLLRLIPQVAPLANLISLLVWLLAIWLSASAAMKLKGWKTFFLPVVTVIIYVVGVWALEIFFGGAALTLNSLLDDFGFR